MSDVSLDADLDRVAAPLMPRRSSRDDEPSSALLAAREHIISSVLRPCLVLRGEAVEMDCAGPDLQRDGFSDLICLPQCSTPFPLSATVLNTVLSLLGLPSGVEELEVKGLHVVKEGEGHVIKVAMSHIRRRCLPPIRR